MPPRASSSRKSRSKSTSAAPAADTRSSSRKGRTSAAAAVTARSYTHTTHPSEQAPLFKDMMMTRGTSSSKKNDTPATPQDLQVEPGTVLLYDYAVAPKKKVQDQDVKMVQWNIERGYKLEGIIQELQAVDADILMLQEVDLLCARSQGKDVMRELCEALGMWGCFAVEFIELDDATRTAANQISAENDGLSPFNGYHGNAILSKWNPLADGVEASSVVKCWPHSINLDWSTKGGELQEPRRGERMVLYADLCRSTSMGGTSGDDEMYNKGSKKGNSMHYHCYCLHLEVFAGAQLRARQLGDAVSHAGYLHNYVNNLDLTLHRYLIAGDLNTMNSGLARLHPRYCKDKFRFLSLGQSEAVWLCANYLRRTCCGPKYGGPTLTPTTMQRYLHGDLELAMFASAEGLCFQDPWCFKDVTMIHKDWNGLVQHKLDWILLSGNVQVDKASMVIGDQGHKLSDHNYLAVTIKGLNQEHPGKDLKVANHQRYNDLVRRMRFNFWGTIVFLLLLAHVANVVCSMMDKTA